MSEIDRGKVKEVMKLNLVRPSDAEMSEIPDVSRDYILALENECNALRELGLQYLDGRIGELASEEELFNIVEKWNASTDVRTHSCDSCGLCTEGITELIHELVGKVGKVPKPVGAGKVPQRQDSTNDQLRDVMVQANKMGCYDAADVISNILGTQATGDDK